MKRNRRYIAPSVGSGYLPEKQMLVEPSTYGVGNVKKK